MFEDLKVESYEYMSSYSFARMSNFVYSEVCTYDQFEKLDQTNLKIINRKDNKIFYICKKLVLAPNFTIFTNRYFLNSLFNELSKIRENLHLNIIVHQTDLPFSKKEFKLIPNNINKIFSINLDFDSSNLIPIPLGLSNSYSNKNLLVEDFSNFKPVDFKDKKDVLYINFSQNTNHLIRDNLYEKFKNYNWTEIDKPNLDKDSYFRKINANKFILSPWGNGIDTHRIWESLYAKSIPVTKYHHTFSTSNNLPIIFVNEYSEISIEFLMSKEDELLRKKYKFDLLKNSYWKNEIISNSNDNSIKYYKLSTLKYFIEINSYKVKIKIEGYKKKLFYYLKKLGNLKK